MKIIALANQKGGVGKTTTTVSIAAALAATRKKVLLVDFDPQGNASSSLGIGFRDRYPGIYEFLADTFPATTIIRDTFLPNLHVIPSSPDLAAVEVELADDPQRKYYLKAKLSELNYDYVFIDCPPTLGLLTLNAMTASDYVVIPTQPEYLAMEGITQLLDTIRSVKQETNPGLHFLGVAFTMFDARNNSHHAVRDSVMKALPSQVFTSIIPRNVKVSEAPSFGKPIMFYSLKCSASQAYIRLAGELIRWIAERSATKKEAGDQLAS